ncbi:MAG: hypothetical protein WKF89_01225 [Chitinophagaceae bacterium]
MATPKTLPVNPPLTKVEPKRKPKGKKVFDLGILLKKQDGGEEKILQKLLASIQKYKFKDKKTTITYQYQWFKSEDVPQLFNLRVYRQTEVVKPGEKSFENNEADHVPSTTSGPPVKKPPLGVLEIFERNTD